MIGADLAFRGLVEVSELVRAREVSPVELVRAAIEQADRWEPSIRSLIARLDERALEEAREAEREIADGGWRGLLHGVPVTIKDVMHVRGVPTTVASPILADNMATESAPAVARLEAAGAIVLAKANTHQFTWGGTTPPTRNPWDLDRIPGGSSGGSGAALAAGIGYGSLGSDTAASVRSPACYNGVVGLKTTFGRIPKSGFYPLAWSLDSVGPMARRVEDVALLLDAISGWDASDPSAVREPMARAAPGLRDGVEGLRVGVPESYFWAPIQTEVDRRLRGAVAALARAGARVEPVELDGAEWIALANPVAFVLIVAESASWHRSWLRDRRDDYAPDVLAYMDTARQISAVDYLDAQRVRRLITEAVDAAFEQVDVLAVPAQAQVAPRWDEERVEFPDGSSDHRDPAGIRNLAIFNLTGHPGVSVPAGLADGLPTGLQLVAKRFDDATALRAAQAVEDELGPLGEPPPPPV